MATASWPTCSRSGTTRCQYQAAPPAPGTSANVVTVHTLALDGVAGPCHGDDMADDPSIQDRITSLIDEEHRLRGALQSGEITVDEEHARLRSVEVELDQCWDLLRQRRARREFGQDPEDAAVREPGTVENYRG